MTVFTKYVELGRVVHVTKGSAQGKLGAIVDIIDVNRLLVHGPEVRRQEIKLRDVYLTKIKLNVPHGMHSKYFLKRWTKSLVEKRFDHSMYAQRLKKLEKRKEITDFGYFKVRNAQSASSRIVAGAFKNLRAENPRAMGKFEKNRQRHMAVRLGYKKVKVLTDEQKKVRVARKLVRHENKKVKSGLKHKEKKEILANRRVARKATTAKKAAAGKLPEREFVPKEKRTHRVKAHPTTPYVSKIKIFRRTRDVERKTSKDQNRTRGQAIRANIVERQVAAKAGKPAPTRIGKAKKVKVTKKVVKKVVAKKA